MFGQIDSPCSSRESGEYRERWSVHWLRPPGKTTLLYPYAVLPINPPVYHPLIQHPTIHPPFIHPSIHPSNPSMCPDNQPDSPPAFMSPRIEMTCVCWYYLRPPKPTTGCVGNPDNGRNWQAVVWQGKALGETGIQQKQGESGPCNLLWKLMRHWSGCNNFPLVFDLIYDKWEGTCIPFHQI